MSQKQVGGKHYKHTEYDPIWLIDKLGLTFIQGNIIKYLFRCDEKGGGVDIDKAISYCNIAFDYKENEIDIAQQCTLSYNDYSTIQIFIVENGLDSYFFEVIISVYFGDFEHTIELLKHHTLYGAH